MIVKVSYKVYTKYILHMKKENIDAYSLEPIHENVQ